MAQITFVRFLSFKFIFYLCVCYFIKYFEGKEKLKILAINRKTGKRNIASQHLIFFLSFFFLFFEQYYIGMNSSEIVNSNARPKYLAQILKPSGPQKAVDSAQHALKWEL